jgi:hypothetical protein
VSQQTTNFQNSSASAHDSLLSISNHQMTLSNASNGQQMTHFQHPASQQTTYFQPPKSKKKLISKLK